LSPCKKDAIHYSLPLKKMIKEKESTEPQKVKTKNDNDNKNENGRERESIDTSRRSFLVSAAMATTAAALAQGKGDVDGGLAVIEDKIAPERNTPITPPGSISASNMAKHCTACQLCVSACPNGVLRPSTNLLTLMQPTSSYERGYCRPECTKCSDVCPAGAIRPITVEDKSSTQIGHAVWIKQNCIPVTDGVNCGNCERHCPTGAIEMVPLHEDEPEGVYIPAVNEAYCIGCGACENLCPARPFSAIYVEGHEVHKTI
jgi:ferredoxin